MSLDTFDCDQVANWVTSLGLGVYEKEFRGSLANKDNGITGAVLIHANHDLLKELSIQSVGQRLHLLKTVYTLKNAQNIPFDEDDYSPECSI